MLVRANLLAVGHARLEYKLGVLGSLLAAVEVEVSRLLTTLEGVQERLYNGVAINVGRQLQDASIEFFDQLSAVGLHVIYVLSEYFHECLHRPRSVHTHRDGGGFGLY